MESAKILLLAVFAACGYGIIHDQITARLCVEYFTVGHKNPFPTEDPTLLGFCWGIYATWWVGLLLGWALIIAARVGRRVPRTAASLVKPTLFLLVVMAAFAAVAGVIGQMLGQTGKLTLNPDIANLVPRNKHAAFVACMLAHSVSYYVGFVGGGIQIAIIWATRKRLPKDLVHRSKQA
ncbi:MAG: hypothetical protein ACRC8S_05060 [Fimbriiglobus sp.]